MISSLQIVVAVRSLNTCANIHLTADTSARSRRRGEEKARRLRPSDKCHAGGEATVPLTATVTLAAKQMSAGRERETLNRPAARNR